MGRIRGSWAAAALVALPALWSCASTNTARRSAETAIAKATISDEDENKLGMQVQSELQKQGVKYLQDPQINAYVTGVANRVLTFAKRDRPGVSWQIHVIDDPKTVNAFATPGGQLYVYTGLLQQVDNEAELAGVMAHEAGHVVARHSARQMVDAYGLEAVASLALGKNPGLAQQLAAKVATGGLMLANSRSDETEADEYGASYAAKAGYDPRALISFFEKLKAKEGHTPAALTLLSDHPATPERISHLQQYIAQRHLGGTELGPERVAPIKQRLLTAK